MLSNKHDLDASRDATECKHTAQHNTYLACAGQSDVVDEEGQASPVISWSDLHVLYQMPDGTKWAEHGNFYDCEDLVSVQNTIPIPAYVAACTHHIVHSFVLAICMSCLFTRQRHYTGDGTMPAMLENYLLGFLTSHKTHVRLSCSAVKVCCAACEVHAVVLRGIVIIASQPCCAKCVLQ